LENSKHSRFIALHILIQLVSKIIKGLIIPKLVSPTLYGLYSSLNIPLRYGQYADCGMAQNLAKRLPAVLAQDGEPGFKNEFREGLSLAVISTSAVAFVIAASTLFQNGQNEWFYRIALPITASTIVVQKLANIFGIAISSKERYLTLSLGGIGLSVLGVILPISFLLTFGIFGLVASIGVAHVVILLYYLRNVSWPGIKLVALSRIKILISGGGILLLLSIAELIMTTVDQLFILWFFTKREFGLYALGLFLSTTLLSVSGFFLTIIRPQMMRYVAMGELKKAHRIINQALSAYLAIVVMLISLGLPLLYCLIHWYLPAYMDGMPVYFLITGMAVVRGPVLLFQPYFIARNETNMVICYYFYAIALAAALNLLVIGMGGGLEYILLASIIAYLCLIVVLLYCFEKRRKIAVERTKYILLSFGTTVTLLFYLAYKNNLSSLALQPAAAKLFLLTLISLVVSLVVLRRRLGYIKRSFAYFWG